MLCLIHPAQASQTSEIALANFGRRYSLTPQPRDWLGLANQNWKKLIQPNELFFIPFASQARRVVPLKDLN